MLGGPCCVVVAGAETLGKWLASGRCHVDAKARTNLPRANLARQFDTMNIAYYYVNWHLEFLEL